MFHRWNNHGLQVSWELDVHVGLHPPTCAVHGPGRLWQFVFGNEWKQDHTNIINHINILTYTNIYSHILTYPSYPSYPSYQNHTYIVVKKQPEMQTGFFLLYSWLPQKGAPQERRARDDWTAQVARAGLMAKNVFRSFVDEDEYEYVTYMSHLYPFIPMSLEWNYEISIWYKWIYPYLFIYILIHSVLSLRWKRRWTGLLHGSSIVAAPQRGKESAPHQRRPRDGPGIGFASRSERIPKVVHG